MTGWLFSGFRFPEDSHQHEVLEKWRPWILKVIDMLDGDGAMRHLPYPGALCDQPAFDMGVLRTIRLEWVRLSNEKISASRGGS